MCIHFDRNIAFALQLDVLWQYNSANSTGKFPGEPMQFTASANDKVFKSSPDGSGAWIHMYDFINFLRTGKFSVIHAS
jgi:hypothetical protein